MHLRTTIPSRRLAFTLSAVLLTGAAPLSHAADIKQSDARYENDKAACQKGRSGQDLATCLTEAARAKDARKKGALDTDMGPAAENARKRCDALASDEKAACLARVDGQGVTSGSVKGGGILRSVETVVAPLAPASGTLVDTRTDSSVPSPVKP